MTEERAKVHLLNMTPHMYEIDDMLDFCGKYGKIYIYGAAENQEYLMKYLEFCGAPVAGYVVSDLANQCLRLKDMPIAAVGDVIKQRDAGIILGLPDGYYRHVIPLLRKAGFTDYFIPTEHNKRSIANQLKPRPHEEMAFEVNVADHCNLDCTMCDHYSQLSGEKFLDVDAYERDISRMGELFGGRIAYVALLGGEPTLHPQLIHLLKVTRQHFPEGQVILLTNGLLLPRLERSPQGNLWQVCREHRVDITVTVYPINFNYEALERKAAEYDVRIALSSNIHADKLTRIVKISDKHTFDPSGEKKPVYFPSCIYFNKFNVLKGGRLYMCPISAHIDIFNNYFNQNLRLEEADSLDIRTVDSWERFAEFTANPVPFCRYCDLRNWHHVGEWKRSSKEIDEYI